MLERVWRKGNPPTLLVGMQTNRATMENSVEIHTSPMFETWGKQSACLCVERHNYQPVREETIIEHFNSGY